MLSDFYFPQRIFFTDKFFANPEPSSIVECQPLETENMTGDELKTKAKELCEEMITRFPTITQNGEHSFQCLYSSIRHEIKRDNISAVKHAINYLHTVAYLTSIICDGENEKCLIILEWHAHFACIQGCIAQLQLMVQQLQCITTGKSIEGILYNFKAAFVKDTIQAFLYPQNADAVEIHMLAANVNAVARQYNIQPIQHDDFATEEHISNSCAYSLKCRFEEAKTFAKALDELQNTIPFISFVPESYTKDEGAKYDCTVGEIADSIKPYFKELNEIFDVQYHDNTGKIRIQPYANAQALIRHKMFAKAYEAGFFENSEKLLASDKCRKLLYLAEGFKNGNTYIDGASTVARKWEPICISATFSSVDDIIVELLNKRNLPPDQSIAIRETIIGIIRDRYLDERDAKRRVESDLQHERDAKRRVESDLQYERDAERRAEKRLLSALVNAAAALEHEGCELSSARTNLQSEQNKRLRVEVELRNVQQEKQLINYEKQKALERNIAYFIQRYNAYTIARIIEKAYIEGYIGLDHNTHLTFTPRVEDMMSEIGNKLKERLDNKGSIKLLIQDIINMITNFFTSINLEEIFLLDQNLKSASTSDALSSGTFAEQYNRLCTQYTSTALLR